MLENIIATIAVFAIIGGALAYIIKSKKNGQKCIGCPHSKTCASKQKGCGCGNSDNKNK